MYILLLVGYSTIIAAHMCQTESSTGQNKEACFLNSTFTSNQHEASMKTTLVEEIN